MMLDVETMQIQVNKGTSIPLVTVVTNDLCLRMLSIARHLTSYHWTTMEMTRIEATRYSFLWRCDESGRYLRWIPRAATPPTEEAIERLRTLPGYILGDLIRTMTDHESIIRSDESTFSVDNDGFGFVEIG